MIDQESLTSIENLHRIKSDGIISEAGFEQSKQRILFGTRPTPATAKSAEVRSRQPHQLGRLPATDDHVGWAILPLRQYSNFKGRSPRREFWMFQLVYVAVFVAAVVIAAIGAGGDALAGILFLAAAALVVPLLAVEVRRFHDQGRSGWFAALNLIPYVGFIIVMIMMLLPGVDGDNQYGPDPQAGN